MHNHQHVAVIIPAFNEERSIAKVIHGLPKCVDRIIVVDKDSADATAERAQAAGAVVVRESESGYGAACLAGIRAAEDAQIIVFIGAGLSDYPHEAIHVIEPVSTRQCELAIGCRFDAEGEAKGRFAHQRLGTYLVCWVIWALFRVKFDDLGPMRCIRAQTLRELNMQDTNYGWTVEMQLKAHLQGRSIDQVPVQSRRRIGRSKISGTVKGSLLAGSKMFYWIFRLFFFRR